MRPHAQLLMLLVLGFSVFLYAQGSGNLIKMERKEVVKIASGLKLGMTEVEAGKYLAARGLTADWTAYESRPEKTNSFEVWYLFGSWTNFENLRVTFHAKRAVSVDQWKVQHPTNSSLVSVAVRLNDRIGTLIPVSLTNAP